MFLACVGQCCLALDLKNKNLNDLQVVAAILVWLDTSPWSKFCQYQKVIITLKAQCWTWEMQHEPLKGMEGICLENLEKYQANIFERGNFREGSKHYWKILPNNFIKKDSRNFRVIFFLNSFFLWRTSYQEFAKLLRIRGLAKGPQSISPL